MAANYNSLNAPTNNSPYGSGNPYYTESTGYITPQPSKKRMSNWIKFGVPVVIIVIIAAVVGGVVGSRHKNNDSSSSSTSKGADAAASSAASAKLDLGRFATATDSYMRPIYPSTTNTAAFTQPTLNSALLSWPKDPFQPPTPNVLQVRPDRPRLIAPSYKWQALPALIKSDPYMQGWNDSIFNNASQYFTLPPVVYFMDGPSGILDNAREIKMRIKAFAYVYRMTNDTKWASRAWDEVENAAGNGTTPFGTDDADRWNSQHFLDVAELCAAYAIAYDWLNDWLSDQQKSQMRTTLIKYGLQNGVDSFNGASFGWWTSKIFGNWNCVCNGGLTLASLAILGDDTSGLAEKLLGLTIENAKANCAQAVSADGTWAETANYWYFGTTGHAEMVSSLLTATGSDFGLIDANPNFSKTGMFHMYVYGPTSLFDWGDHGPNKFSSTANAMMLYADIFKKPQYALFQRDQNDAAEPWSMFWYNTQYTGAFWDNTPLDNSFSDSSDQWASMRSSWTDENALFIGIKAGTLQNHQTHNDLDAGDFVLDALGTRWAGEFGSADYRSPDYFSNDTQGSARWLYYRKMTEGQNTILLNKANQNVAAAPTINFNSSGTVQGSSTVFEVPDDSTAFWTADISSAYFNNAKVARGIRMLNKRRQVLLQDEIQSTDSVEWRMQTNSTISIDNGGTSATLTLAGQTMKVSMLNAPSGAQFTQSAAKRFDSDPTPPVPDQDNPGVSVLIIDLPAGTYTLQVLFSPQWPGLSASDYVTPPSVALANWALDSHNN